MDFVEMANFSTFGACLFIRGAVLAASLVGFFSTTNAYVHLCGTQLGLNMSQEHIVFLHWISLIPLTLDTS